MRLLGLDVGDRTIGVAVSDPLGIIAQGITTIRRKKLDLDIDEVISYCKQYEITKIIMGMPKNMNGTIGFQGEKVQKFSEDVKLKIDIPIIFWDERLTTVAAHRAMLEADLSRKKRKKIVDKIAATYILQGYLDSIK